MSKKVIRYFWGFIDAQQKWLNSMVDKGWRLAKAGELIYEFEPCEAGKYTYCIDFVGEKSYLELKKYIEFLQEMGYKVFTKNINLDWNMGKATYRPAAVGMGKVATSPGVYNKELLIVEKVSDGKPFELHTTPEDKLYYYNTQKNAYMAILIFLLLMGAWNIYKNGGFSAQSTVILVLALVVSLPAIISENNLRRIKKDRDMQE